MERSKQLAFRLSKQRNQPEALWSVALGKSRGLIDKGWLDEEQMERLASACPSPRQLLLVVEYASKQDPQNTGFAQMLDRIDESPYSLPAWLEAIETFHDWISRQGQSTTLEMALGFLSCCAAANPNTPTERALKDTALDMLEQFGFDG